MNKSKIAIIVVVLLGFYSCLVQANITVTGIGEIKVEPNIAMFDIAVETKAATAKSAALTNAEQTSKIIKGLKKIIKEKHAITTQAYNLYQDYQYNNNTKLNELIGFKAVNQINIKTKALEDLGFLLDTVTNMGVTTINNLQFSYDNPEVVFQQSLAKAVQNANERANILAAASALHLDGIISVDTTFSNNCSVPGPRRMFAMGMGSKGLPPTPIEPGNLDIETTVQVVFKTKKFQ